MLSIFILSRIRLKDVYLIKIVQCKISDYKTCRIRYHNISHHIHNFNNDGISSEKDITFILESIRIRPYIFVYVPSINIFYY